jgi:carbonic anhydrase
MWGMAGATNVDGLVAKAKARARAAGMAARPRLQTVILTCMDARIDPAALFDLKPGEVHVLRNAAAQATPDVLRSLAVSQSLLGTTEILVLGHTECGLLGQTEEQVAAAVKRASGHLPDIPMGVFADVDEAVYRSVEAIRDCKFLPHRESVRGYVLDVKNGTLRAAGEVASKPETRAAPPLPLGLSSLRADVLNLKRGR